jgi:hypothetical protein
MFVTVGTSLFHSATWEWVEGMRVEVAPYEGWTKDDELLKNPERRKSSREAACIMEGLKKRLDLENARTWASRLPKSLLAGEPEPDTVMRYSAELATILKLAEKENRGDERLGDFLRSYEAIHFVCDPKRYDEKRSLTQVAAVHLARYVNEIAKEKKAEECPIPGLSSHRKDDLLADSNTRGLRLLAETLRQASAVHQHVDILLSGGYKIYGIFLAPLFQDSRFRMAYIHEEGERLLTLQGTGKKDDSLWAKLKAEVGHFGIEP